MKHSILLSLFFTALLFSCGEQKSVESNKVTIADNKKSEKPQGKVTQYWESLQKQTGITNAQRDKILATQAKFRKKIETLKKAGNWEGEKNKKNRLFISSNTRKEVQSILGPELYKKKLAFDRASKMKK